MVGFGSLLATFSILSLVGYYARQRRIQRQIEDQFGAQNGCKPPRRWSAKWPQGLDLLLKATRHARDQTILQFFLDVIESSGATHEQQLLGASNIGTTDPRNIEEILSNQFQNFSLGLRPKHFAPLMGSGIFTQDGKAWRHSRALLSPQFRSNRFQNFEEIRKCVESLIDNIPADGIVDLQPLFFRLTFDTTTFLLFGETMSSLESSDVAGQESEFANAFNSAQEYLSHRGRLGELYWLTNTREFRRVCQLSQKFVDQAVKRALDAANQPGSEKTLYKKNYVFIDALIEETRDTKQLRDQCLNILLAGRDTTAVCLSWTIRLLARHQQVLDKLRSEVQSIVGLGEAAEIPSREHLKRMQYLDLVLKEVLRLYPSVPVNSRTALKTTTLPLGGGPDGSHPVLVRKGAAVGYCVYAMHRRTDIYGADAYEFRPERWADGELAKNVGYGYLPFNGGPRLCLGQDFALLEASYTVVRLIQRFPYINVPVGEQVLPVGRERQTLTLVVASGDGCRVQLRTGPDC